jgi:hypothetical protein
MSKLNCKTPLAVRTKAYVRRRQHGRYFFSSREVTLDLCGVPEDEAEVRAVLEGMVKAGKLFRDRRRYTTVNQEPTQ